MDLDWIAQIDEMELVAYAPPLAFVREGAFDIEEAAAYLYKGGPFPPELSLKPQRPFEMRVDDRPPKRYWKQVKKEVYLLICTEDEKYAKLRKRIGKTRKKSGASIAAVVAAVLGDELGAEATLLTGFCAIALFGVVKIGKEAYCEIEKEKSA